MNDSQASGLTVRDNEPDLKIVMIIFSTQSSAGVSKSEIENGCKACIEV